MNAKEKEKQEAREYLLELLKPGDTVHTVLRHVSRSGMYRVITLHVIKENNVIDISWQAAKLLEGYDQRHNGCKAGGCGMDMGFHLVYGLSYNLWPKGYQCSGNNREDHYCQSNDHFNHPYPERDGQMWHNDGGYALNQHWM